MQVSDTVSKVLTLNWIAADAVADEPAALSDGFCAAPEDAELPELPVLADAVSPEGVVALAVAVWVPFILT